MADIRDEPRLTAKGRATRDRIVLATAELIVTEGLAAFNMDNVRKAASSAVPNWRTTLPTNAH